jgi:hypothetical protein
MSIPLPELQRGMALHYLKEYKRQTVFRVNRRIAQVTLDELQNRGCQVDLDSENALYVITSPVPFGQLVTSEEWKQDRLMNAHGCGWILLSRGGYIAVIMLAVSLNMGILTTGIWVIGWVAITSAAFPNNGNLRDRAMCLLIGLAIFCIGIVVNLFGVLLQF